MEAGERGLRWRKYSVPASKQQQNSHSQSTKYHGVRLKEESGEWEAYIEEPKYVSLGFYPTAKIAAAAYDVAALNLFGNGNGKNVGADLNFPDAILEYMLPASPTVDDIRAVAERAVAIGSSAPVYFDEEEVFNMPSLLTDMAHGMLVTPPRFDDSLDQTQEEYFTLGNLWKSSI